MPTTRNRKYCTEQGITTCFAAKGPRPKDEDADLSTARRIIGTLRSTSMEGSFGNQKHVIISSWRIASTQCSKRRLYSLFLWHPYGQCPQHFAARKKSRLEEGERQQEKRAIKLTGFLILRCYRRLHHAFCVSDFLISLICSCDFYHRWSVSGHISHPRPISQPQFYAIY